MIAHAPLRTLITEDDVDPRRTCDGRGPSTRPVYVERVCVHATGRVRIVPMREVEWIEAFGNYIRLHTTTERLVLRESIRRISERLDPARFARIHRSAIVRLDAIKEVAPSASGDYIVELSTGARLRLSRSHWPEFDRRLSLLT